MNKRTLLVLACFVLTSCDEDNTYTDTSHDPVEDTSETVDVVWDTETDVPAETEDTPSETPTDTPVERDMSTGSDCMGTFNCIAECADDTDCEIGCIAAMCEPSRTPLNTLNGCLTSHCNAHCYDRTSDGCWTCLNSYCSEELAACESAGC